MINAMKATVSRSRIRASVLCVFTAAAMLFAFAFPGCAAREEPVTAELFAMDTFIVLKAYGDNAADAVASSEETIKRLSRLLSVTDEGSEVYALDHADGAETPVSPEVFDLISRSLALSSELGESFELTIYPVLRAWGFTTDNERVPADAEIEELLALVDDGSAVLNAEGRTVRLPAGAQIDLGAVAKGYAGDAAAELMRANGVDSALLDLGSSTIVAIGAKPDGSAWRIAVKDPFGRSDRAGIIEATDVSVSTSGGYERYFVGDDGETYWHIIDPATGRPAKSGLVSVTVLCKSAFLGDALSTALFVMGAEAAEAYWRAVGGFDYILITEEGKLIMTPGAAELFTPSGAYAQGEPAVIGR